MCNQIKEAMETGQVDIRNANYDQTDFYKRFN